MLQLRPSLQRLYPSILTFDGRIGTGEKECNMRGDFIAEGSLGCGEGLLGDELVVLFVDVRGREVDRGWGGRGWSLRGLF